MSMKPLMFLVTLSAVMPTWAVNWYVAPEGDDTNTGTSWSVPTKTIQAAVDKAAASGDVVYLSNGVYTLTAPVTVTDKILTISSKDSSNWDDVIIDGQGVTACFRFLKSGNNALRFVTVQNGVGAPLAGGTTYFSGGVYMAGGGITGCRIRNCHTYIDSGSAVFSASGGGLYSGSGYMENSLVVNCSITNITTSSSPMGFTSGGGAYCTGTVRATVISNCHVYVCAQNCTSSTHALRGSGGGLLFNSSATVVATNCTITDCSVLATSVNAQGFGGGVEIFGAGCLVDSRVSGNVSSAGGGGVHVNSGGHVLACTVSDNTVRVERVSSGANLGGGIMVANTGSRVENSLICGNMITNKIQHGDPGGGGAIGVAGDNARILNCEMRGNTGFNGGALLLYNGLGTVVSNCVMSDNFSVRRGGCIYVTKDPGVLITDCLVSGNLSYLWSDGTFLARHAEGSGGAITVRNTFITGHGDLGHSPPFVWFYKGTTTGVTPLAFEHCTIAGNLSGGNAVFTLSSAACATNFFARGCAVADNGYYTLFNTTAYTGMTNIFWHSYASGKYGAPTAPETGNLFGADGVVPRFVDAAHGNWHLASRSPLFNTLSPSDWMLPDGKPSKTILDMGDGTFTRGTVARWGITLTRDNARPRLCGEKADMGCFEFFYRTGFTVSIR